MSVVAASFGTAQTREMPRWLRGEYDDASKRPSPLAARDG